MERFTKDMFNSRLLVLKSTKLTSPTWRDVMAVSARPDSAPGEVEQMEKDLDSVNPYLEKFITPFTLEDGTPACVCCQRRWPGNELMGALGLGETSLQWGIQHGVAFCRVCGWPSVVYHYDLGKGTNAEVLITRLNLALQVHPRDVQERTK